MTDFDALTVLGIGAAYFLGSIIKGITGFGALLIAIPLMSLVADAPGAIALTTVPVLFSNIWQLVESREGTWAIRRFRVLSVFLVAATFAGSQFLVRFDPSLSAGVIGVVVVLFCLSKVFPLRLSFQTDRDHLVAPTVGVVAGVIGGTSNLSGTILIMYLVSLRLEKNRFIGAIALLYLFSSIPIYLTLSWFDHYSDQQLWISAGLLIPAFAGLAVGRRVRDFVSQAMFERVVTGLLFCLGIVLLARAF